MNHGLKFIAAFAVMASFSALAADPIQGANTNDTTDMASAVTTAGDGTTSVAVIIQTGGTSFASIDQSNINSAVILQTNSDSRAAIVQTGTGNIGVIVQQPGK
jgi:hypothetical protein